LAPAGHDDAVAAIVECFGKRAADAAGAAGDQDGVSSHLHDSCLSIGWFKEKAAAIPAASVPELLEGLRMGQAMGASRAQEKGMEGSRALPQR
jgi:hypothetical protein